MPGRCAGFVQCSNRCLRRGPRCEHLRHRAEPFAAARRICIDDIGDRRHIAPMRPCKQRCLVAHHRRTGCGRIKGIHRTSRRLAVRRLSVTRLPRLSCQLLTRLRDRRDRRLLQIERDKQRPARARSACVVLAANLLIVARIAAKMPEECFDVAGRTHVAAVVSMPAREVPDLLLATADCSEVRAAKTAKTEFRHLSGISAKPKFERSVFVEFAHLRN
jgi:hypothetical protein